MDESMSEGHERKGKGKTETERERDLGQAMFFAII